MAEPVDPDKVLEQIRKAREAISDPEALKELKELEEALALLPDKADTVSESVRRLHKEYRDLADGARPSVR